jgi:ubiquitin carboxyl-terminal hydrolase 9/24
VIKSNASSDSRRSYQLIKFLVSLSSKCAPAKDYLLKSPINWHWSVSWLKKKVRDGTL